MTQLDWDQFLERVECNEALALELAHDLILCIDTRVENLEYAMGQGELRKIEHAAHSLRGLVAPYGCRDLLALLKVIEERARARTFDSLALPMDISRMVMELKEELAQKISALESPLADPLDPLHFLNGN